MLDHEPDAALCCTRCRVDRARYELPLTVEGEVCVRAALCVTCFGDLRRWLIGLPVHATRTLVLSPPRIRMPRRKKAPEPPASVSTPASTVAKAITSIDDLTLDSQNANLGTERGAALLKESLEACGAGRSILTDRNGVVIAGNKTLREAKARGLAIEVVQVTGNELVVVQRTDLNLIEDRRARQLAYYDNRVPQIDLQWDPAQVQRDMLAGVDLSVAFFPEELDAITAKLTPESPEPQEVVDGTDGAVAEPSGDSQATPATGTGTATTTQAPTVSTRSTYALIFDELDQHLAWSALMRRLRDKYPSQETGGARLSAYLTECCGIEVPA